MYSWYSDDYYFWYSNETTERGRSISASLTIHQNKTFINALSLTTCKVDNVTSVDFGKKSVAALLTGRA